MLYEDPWWRDDESGGDGDFPVGILYIILFFVVLHYLTKLIKMIKEKRAEKPTERPTENPVQHPLRNEVREEREKQKQDPPHEEWIDELFDKGIYKMPDIPGHVRCGTPFLKQRRDQDNRLSKKNILGWKDRTGYVLTNEEVGFVRKYYSICMTPVIHKMFNEAGINDEIGYILSHSSFRIHPYPEKEFEVDFCHYMVKPLIVSMVKQQFDAYRELSVIDVWDIADSILGEKDHDFDWLELNYGIKWKGESLDSDDVEESEMPPPY